jgi:large subunit ribosomal protein L15
MSLLSQLKNTHRPKKKIQRVGRGFGSHRGKTCGRGGKGDKARSGYKRRYGHEGGQLPLYRRLPCRGFDSKRFHKETYAVNFALINRIFADGDVVSYETLRQKGYAPRNKKAGLKILSGGELLKKVSIEATAFSQPAAEYLEKKKISHKIVSIPS